ncbi:hypothetical protein D3C71_2249120 [compost metagenome]
MSSDKLHKLILIDYILCSQLIGNLKDSEAFWYSKANCFSRYGITRIQLRNNRIFIHPCMKLV